MDTLALPFDPLFKADPSTKLLGILLQGSSSNIRPPPRGDSCGAAVPSYLASIWDNSEGPTQL